MTQVVDVNVSQIKFDRSVARYRAIEPTLVARGWWMMRAEFPFVTVSFMTVNMKPHVMALAVRIDFSDFDLLPLSVKFVDPFEDRELAGPELLTRMKRLDPAMPPDMIEALKGQGVSLPVQDLIQAYGDQPGFLCLPGVREYHAHPAHTGDPWELHRFAGEGSMHNILETIWRYGSAPLSQLGFQIGMSLQQSQVPA